MKAFQHQTWITAKAYPVPIQYVDASGTQTEYILQLSARVAKTMHEA